MPNEHIRQRLRGLQTILTGVHQSSVSMSSASKGTEREAFVDQFLSNVLPPIFRFGSGDATDSKGQKSGQLDVVVEYPFAPSLPIIGSAQTRLYLAEAVAAVIEVKSNISNQWNEVEDTGKKLAPLKRCYGASMVMGRPPAASIELFAVGYTGWKKMETLESHIQQSSSVFGALIIDSGLYFSKSGISASGELALWGLISDIHLITNSLQSASTNPLDYFME